MKYTELELKVIKAFRASMNYDTLEDNLEDNCTCLDVQELSEITGLDIKTVKGVVGSLAKKDLIYVETFNLGQTALMVDNFGIEEYFRLFGKTTYSINDLCAYAWECAIDNAAVIINLELGTNFNRSDDFSIVEQLASRMGLKFDENGGLVDLELIAMVGSRKLYRVKEA